MTTPKAAFMAVVGELDKILSSAVPIENQRRSDPSDAVGRNKSLESTRIRHGQRRSIALDGSKRADEETTLADQGVDAQRVLVGIVIRRRLVLVEESNEAFPVIGNVLHAVAELMGAGVTGREAMWPEAYAAANGQDLCFVGGANTIRQYLRAGLIDELHVAIAAVLLGSRERLFEDFDMPALGCACVQSVATEKAMHVVLRRTASAHP